MKRIRKLPIEALFRLDLQCVLRIHVVRSAHDVELLTCVAPAGIPPWTSLGIDDNSELGFEPRRKCHEQSTICTGVQGRGGSTGSRTRPSSQRGIPSSARCGCPTVVTNGCYETIQDRRHSAPHTGALCHCRQYLKDRDHLRIETTVEDPDALTAPWRYTLTYQRSDIPFVESYNCDTDRDSQGEPDLRPPPRPAI